MKISYKLVLIMGVLIILSVLISGSVYYLIAKQSVEDRIGAQLETAVVLKQNHITYFIDEKERDIESIAAEKDILDNFIKIHEAGSGQEKNGTVYVKKIEQLLDERMVHRENFFRLSILSPRGKTIVSTDETEVGKIKSYKYLKEKETHFHNFYYDLELQQPVMSITTPIKDNNEKIIGVLVGLINLEGISDIMIERSGLGETGETYLVNKFNLLVSESRFIEGIEFKKLIRTKDVEGCAEKNEGYEIYNDYRDLPVIGVYRWIPEIEICLIAKMDQKEAYGPIDRLWAMSFSGNS
jgi:hypothetical protein